jgi:hypothetical protein
MKAPIVGGGNIAAMSCVAVIVSKGFRNESNYA